MEMIAPSFYRDILICHQLTKENTKYNLFFFFFFCTYIFFCDEKLCLHINEVPFRKELNPFVAAGT